MGVYTQPSGNWATRRGVFLIALILFHMAFFWALKSGFAVELIKQITQPIKAEIINEVLPEEPPPPPPEVQMELPPVQVPPVLVDIQLPSPPATAIQAPVTDQPTPPAPPPPPAVTRSVVVTKAAVTYRPDTADYYPATSKNMGEQGRVRIRLCIGANGRVTEAAVAEPSQYPRLDEAGVRMARAYRFKVGTEDGKPKTSDCFIQPITFSLTEEQG